MKMNQPDDCGHEDCHPGLRERLLASLVQPVPDGLALCEFDCSKAECSVEEWKHCKRRLEERKARDSHIS